MAPPRQLRCADLKGGDILVQFSTGNVVGKLIALGQAMVGDKNSEFVHAGVMLDKHYMAEALMQGITAADLRIQNKPYSYRVYRPRDPMLGATEANVAKFLFEHHQNHGSMPYTVGGAVAAIGVAKPMTASHVDGVMDKIFTGSSSAFFCSQFVVLSYQLAAAQMGMSPSSVFPLDDTKMPPSRLATACEQSVAFEQLGYIAPNER